MLTTLKLRALYKKKKHNVIEKGGMDHTEEKDSFDTFTWQMIDTEKKTYGSVTNKLIEKNGLKTTTW